MNIETTWPDLPDPRRARRPAGWARLVVFAVVGAWVAAFAVWVVARRTDHLSVGYALSEASAERRSLLDERRSLELEVASLRSPGRVGVAAAGRMGLRPAAPGEMRRLDPGAQP